MNVDQIVKQVDWLDDARRKDQTRIGSLEEHITALENNLTNLISKVNNQDSHITRLETLVSRMDGYDEDLLQMRRETKQQVDDLEKQFRKRDEDTSKIRLTEISAIDKSISEIRTEIEVIQDLKRSISARVDEENRLARLIEETQTRIESVDRNQEEYLRTVKLMNDGRRQDSKRLTDLHGEVTALRKRSDEQRSNIDLNAANQKKTETRINEFSVLEIERREAMEKFLENQTIRDVERERVWKDWQNRFVVIENQASEIENHLEMLETTRRDLGRTHKTVEDLSEKVERRVNEITEVQRLTDERFRQEWVTFKADDQKRWTNYTLTMDEQRGEMQRQFDKMAQRVTHIEDDLQELRDVYTQMTEQTEKRLQTLLSTVHEWVSTFERTLGRPHQ